jgi:Glycosyl transferases group 1
VDPVKRLLFVDHEFHGKTRSHEFFLRLLETRFEVSYVALSPLEPFDRRALDLPCDVALLWQMDVLAPHFLARDVPTVVCPMYDGSASLPDLHWVALRRARFVNFSYALHNAVRLAGADSLHAKYYPDPSPLPACGDFSTLRAFLWVRRPEEAIDCAFVERMLGDQLESLHLHEAPDYRGAAAPAVREDTPFRVTRSTWFPERGELDRILSECNVYIAPRQAEGIGMGFLEAMARGMAVIANDLPTHNEYIANWVNGVLIDRKRTGRFAARRFDAIGAKARLSVELGRRHWLEQQDAILRFIDAAEPPGIAATGGLLEDFALDLIGAYQRGGHAYQAFLADNYLALGLLGERRRRPRRDAGADGPADAAAGAAADRSPEAWSRSGLRVA